MGDTRNALLSLLALAHAESLPALSFADICAFLPAPQTKKRVTAEISSLLAHLEKERVIFSRDERYSLAKTPDIDEIKKRAEIARQKIARNRFFFSLMQMIPFVEASAITGSVSMENANEKSDIDIFCVVKRGRIWTARILLLTLAELFGRRRDQRYALDKLCFNCFITNNASFPLQNIASAHMLARAIPLFENGPLETFFAENAWMHEYVSRPSFAPLISFSRPFRAISLATAWLLSGSIGNALERALARWQMRRLRNKIKDGNDSSGLILREDVVTLYYPDNKNKTIMARYINALKQIDF